jgi:hypothetical protein
VVCVLDCLPERLQDTDGGLLEVATRLSMWSLIYYGGRHGDGQLIHALGKSVALAHGFDDEGLNFGHGTGTFPARNCHGLAMGLRRKRMGKSRGNRGE